jgi:hypothetical protein
VAEFQAATFVGQPEGTYNLVIRGVPNTIRTPAGYE